MPSSGWLLEENGVERPSPVVGENKRRPSRLREVGKGPEDVLRALNFPASTRKTPCGP